MKQQDYLFVKRVLLSALVDQDKVCINLINLFKKKYPLEKEYIKEFKQILNGTYISKATL